MMIRTVKVFFFFLVHFYSLIRVSYGALITSHTTCALMCTIVRARDTNWQEEEEATRASWTERDGDDHQLLNHGPTTTSTRPPCAHVTDIISFYVRGLYVV